MRAVVERSANAEAAARSTSNRPSPSGSSKEDEEKSERTERCSGLPVLLDLGRSESGELHDVSPVGLDVERRHLEGGGRGKGRGKEGERRRKKDEEEERGPLRKGREGVEGGFLESLGAVGRRERVVGAKNQSGSLPSPPDNLMSLLAQHRSTIELSSRPQRWDERGTNGRATIAGRTRNSTQETGVRSSKS